MTWLEELNKISPKLCRAVAKPDNGRPISHVKLGRRAGLTKSQIIRITKLDRWDSLPADIIQRYTAACGIDLRRPRHSLFHCFRRASFLKRLTPAQARMYDRLLPKVSES